MFSADAAQRQEMRVRDGGDAQAGVFPGLPRSGADPGRAPMRVRAPVNRGRRRAAEGFMADDVSRMVSRVMAGVLLAGFALGGCVQSKTQLVSGTKPLLGRSYPLAETQVPDPTRGLGFLHLLLLATF
jgi:hypothetical protein